MRLFGEHFPIAAGNDRRIQWCRPFESPQAYHTLVFEMRNADLINTLGRATVSICDELAKQRVPTDDPEHSLLVFCSVRESLLLAEHRTSLFAGFHVALQRLTAAVLSLPKDSQKLLFAG